MNIQINIEDVKYAINKMQKVNASSPSAYQEGIIKVFTDYLEHQNFKRMRDELEETPKPWSNRDWDFDTKAGFIEVIYPSDSVMPIIKFAIA